MTNQPVGYLRKLLNGLASWLQAMDYSAFDYANERILGLERHVASQQEDLVDVARIVGYLSFGPGVR